MPNLPGTLSSPTSADVLPRKCAVIIPVGPGHEVVVRSALASVEGSFRLNPGPFTEMIPLLMPDPAGEHGRSQRRNDGIDYALANNIEWIFFLDADDIAVADTFACASPYIDEYDAIFGLIADCNVTTPQEAKLRPNQLGPTQDLADILRADPYFSLQMGHFVRTAAAAAVRFDTEMDTGEDFKYYLNLWSRFRCAKIDRVLFINRKGFHSTGPRSADGGRWRRTVLELIQNFSAERLSR
jgi:hypothetical protein